MFLNKHKPHFCKAAKPFMDFNEIQNYIYGAIIMMLFNLEIGPSVMASVIYTKN